MMGGRWRARLRRVWILALGLGVGGALGLRAEGPSLFLDADLDETGVAEVWLWVDDLDEHLVEDEAALYAALRAAMPCPLDEERTDDYGAALVARCPGGERRRATVAWSLDLSPLTPALRAAGAEGLSVWLSHTRTGFARSRELSIWSRQRSTITWAGELPLTDHSPRLELLYGYTSGDLAVRSTVLLALLLIPPLLLHRFRRRALSHDGPPEVAWFDFWRRSRLLGQGTWLSWVIALLGLEAGRVTSWLLPSVWQLGVDLILFFLLPAAVIVTCHLMSAPVFRAVRGVDRRRSELLQEVVGLLLWRMAPLIVLLLAFARFFDGSGGPSPWLFATPLPLIMLGIWLFRRGTELRPDALSMGELRDRAFALAKRAGVALSQLYLVPATRLQMANAFASQGNNLLLTDFLVERASRREIDAVLGHELTHLRRRHPQKLVMLTLAALSLAALGAFGADYVFWAAAASWNPADGQIGLAASAPLLLRALLAGAVAVGALLLLLSFYRRFELTADDGAARLTGDPEGVIQLLGRLARLNLVPVVESRGWTLWSTHPPIRRRARAVARRHAIPAERVEELLDVADPGASRYPLDDQDAAEARLFTSSFKALASLRLTLLLTVSGVALPWLVWQLVAAAGWTGGSRLAALCIGLLLSPVLVINATDLLAPWGYDRLRHRLARRLDENGLELSNAGFVGLIPDGEGGIFEGQASWDVGFIRLQGAELVFYGDRVRFALPRTVVLASRLVDGPPQWIRAPALQLDWRTPDGEERSLQLRGLARTIRGGRRATRALAARVASWQRGDGPQVRDDGGSGIGLPGWSEVTRSPRPRLRRLLLLAVGFGFLAFAMGGAGGHFASGAYVGASAALSLALLFWPARARRRG